MDNRYLENVIAEMKPFLDENGFSELEGAFKSETKAVKVEYSDARQMFLLNIADIDESEIGEYREISAWLFDDSQNAKDAVSVGMDFVVTLRKELGIKIKRVANTTEVELPTATKSGNITIAGFTKKMLDIFPTLKDEYKNHVATYGNFLYLNFYGDFLVKNFKKAFLTASTKQLKKFVDVLRDGYVKGDRDTVNIVVALLCAASYKDDEVAAKIKDSLAEDKHFLTSFQNFMPVFEKNTKLRNVLVK